MISIRLTAERLASPLSLIKEATQKKLRANRGKRGMKPNASAVAAQAGNAFLTLQSPTHTFSSSNAPSGRGLVCHDRSFRVLSMTRQPIRFGAYPLEDYRAHRDSIQQALQRVLEHGHYILGNEVAVFEQEFASFVGVTHSI